MLKENSKKLIEILGIEEDHRFNDLKEILREGRCPGAAGSYRLIKTVEDQIDVTQRYLIRKIEKNPEILFESDKPLYMASKLTRYAIENNAKLGEFFNRELRAIRNPDKEGLERIGWSEGYMEFVTLAFYNVLEKLEGVEINRDNFKEMKEKTQRIYDLLYYRYRKNIYPVCLEQIHKRLQNLSRKIYEIEKKELIDKARKDPKFLEELIDHALEKAGYRSIKCPM